MPSFGEVFSGVFVVRWLIGVVTAAVAAWGVAFFVSDWISDKYIRGFDSSISSLTAAVTDLSGRLQAESAQLRNEKTALAEDIAQRIATAQGEQKNRSDGLTTEIRDLTAQLRETNASLGNLTLSVGELDKSIQAVDYKLSGSIERQASFERFVMGVLGSQFDPKTKVDLETTWFADSQTGLLADLVAKGDNPFLAWSKAAGYTIVDKPDPKLKLPDNQ